MQERRDAEAMILIVSSIDCAVGLSIGLEWHYKTL